MGRLDYIPDGTYLTVYTIYISILVLNPFLIGEVHLNFWKLGSY